MTRAKYVVAHLHGLRPNAQILISHIIHNPKRAHVQLINDITDSDTRTHM